MVKAEQSGGRLEDVRGFIGGLYGPDSHAKRVASLAGAGAVAKVVEIGWWRSLWFVQRTISGVSAPAETTPWKRLVGPVIDNDRLR